MTFLMHRPRRSCRVSYLLSAVGTTVAVSGVLLAGCGSGSGTLPLVTGSGTLGSSSSIGRTFSAGGLSLGTNRSGALTTQVNADGRAIGSLTLASTRAQPTAATAIAAPPGFPAGRTRARQTAAGTTIPLTGTGNPATGQFSLSGAGTLDGESVQITVTGTLPAVGATTGGTIAITINGTAYPAFSFNGSTSTGGTTPTPTPTPSPTASAGPTPMPNPTSDPTPAPGDNTLARYILSSPRNATLTFRETNTYTIAGQPPSTTTDQYTEQAGLLFSSGRTGQQTAVTLATDQGNVTVTRREELDDEGRVVGYEYYTLDSSAYTQYGSDSLDGDGNVTNRTRYSPALRYTLNLRVGQSATTTGRITQTSIDRDTGITTAQTFDLTFTITFVGTESVTTPAGTFSDVARVRVESAYSGHGQAGPLAGPFSVNSTGVSFLAATLGEVKSSSNSHSTYTVTDPTTGQPITSVSNYVRESELIAITNNP